MDMNPVTQRAEYKLRAFENIVLRNVFVSMRQKRAENCTKFRDKMFHDMQFSPGIIS